MGIQNFYNTSSVIFIIGILAAIFIEYFEMEKKTGYYNENKKWKEDNEVKNSVRTQSR